MSVTEPVRHLHTFEPSNWYWIVNNDELLVYSSAIGEYVTVENMEYVAWTATGRRATRIASEDDLAQVLATHDRRPQASREAMVNKYLDTKLDRVDKVAFMVMLNHENRIRTLEARPQINAAQFREALKPFF